MVTKKPLIVVCICAVVLLVLGSLSNVVGYQTVTTSQQKLIKERINQRELLFQTICDIANSKEIQGIILKSQISRGNFINQDFRFPVLTKNQLKHMYLVGMIFSKVFSKSRIHSMIQQYQSLSPITQEEINDVIEKDVTLRNEIAQLQNSECDCENENTIIWHFPVICLILLPLRNIAVFASIIIESFTGIFFPLFLTIISDIGYQLDCFWIGYPI